MLDFKIIASGSSGNCYRLSYGGNDLLIECGISWKRIQKGLDFNSKRISGCLVSHYHNDHSKAIRDVLKAGIDVFASKETFDHFKIDNHRAQIVDSLILEEWPPWRILPFNVVHDCPGSFGFLISIEDKKVLYATDTAYIKYAFKGLTHIAIECNFQTDILKENVKEGTVPRMLRRRVNRNHFSLERVLRFLESTDLSKVDKIYLLHLSKNNADPTDMKKSVQALTGKEVVVSS